MSGPPIQVALDEMIAEAVQLRLLAEIPPVSAGPDQASEYLRDARRRQDRVEELLRQAIRINARAQRAAAAAKHRADDAWDEAVLKRNSQSARRPLGEEYSSARERHAWANLEVVDVRDEQRTADELAHLCAEALSVIKSAYWGLSEVRGDVRELLRTHTVESHLER